MRLDSGSAGPRPAFVFAPDRCTGCEACRIACGIENAAGRDTGWRVVTTLNPGRHPALPTRHLSLACNHCDTPVCALGCPANAYRRDAATGAVLLDPDLCLGCRYCSWLCPYDAPSFGASAGVMTKCTFCSPRIAAGGQPACTQACPTGALVLGARNGDEPEPALAGLGVTGLGPALQVLPPRSAAAPPAVAIDAALDGAPVQPGPPPKITLGSEWSLAAFTVVMPSLVAWLAAGFVRPERAPALPAFLGLGGLALAVSTLHLGRPLRAWRAVLNVRSSWLSREAAFTAAFLGLGAAWLAVSSVPALGVAALAAGAGLAISIDAVYREIPRDEAPPVHSSDASLATPLLVGIGTGTPLVAAAAGAATAILFVQRWRRGRLGLTSPLGVVRVASLALAFVPGIPWPAAFLAAVLGETVDRCAFYADLDPSTPAARMQREFCFASKPADR